MSIQPRAWLFVAGIAMAMLAAAAAAQTPAAPPRESFDDLYRRGQQANAGIRTLTADFTESTTSSLLTRPLVARGTLTVERPSRVILRYAEPERRVVLIDGNRLTMTWPSRKLRQETDIRRAQERVQRYFVDAGAAELRREFDIEPRPDSENPGAHEVTLRPKRRQIRETLARLDLWVDPATALLTSMRMTFANGDTKTMRFERVTMNPALDADAFSVER